MTDDLGVTFSPVGGNTRRDHRDWPAQLFAMEALPRLVVGRDLSVLALNPRANEVIENNGSLIVKEGMLTGRDRRSAGAVAAAVAAADRKARLIAICTEGRAALLVETFALGEGKDAPVALTLRDLSAGVEIDCADLEPIFGVTPGEHQVLVKLLQGHSSRDIAEEFGKSILTIRTHVKRAYGKIGVKTRGQLFARLLPYLSIR
ncbi:MAG: helix-turn-helix transcriptional regulator [Caulobacterales bacterium]